MEFATGAALGIVAFLGLWAAFVIWRRRSEWLYCFRRRFGSRVPQHPVVLIHGLMGFDKLASQEYFRGVRGHLQAAGVAVHVVRLPPLGGIAERAQALQSQLEAIPGRVTLIAHSMGGLDARYALARLGLASKARALITIGTPHRGSRLADLGERLVGLGPRQLARRLGIEIGALVDLQPGRAARFNVEVEDVRGVFYGSVVGVASQRVHPLLKLPKTLLGSEANDGLVPAASQPWGHVLETVEADHFAQIGWSKDFAANDLYVRIVRELAWRGF